MSATRAKKALHWEGGGMRIVQIKRRIEHKLWLGGYETISPNIEYIADLEEGEDLIKAQSELDAVVEKLWHLAALKELRLVHARRKAENTVWSDDQIESLMNGIKFVMRNGS